MHHVLAHPKVSSFFWKYLQAFGQKRYAQDECFSGCDVAVVKDEAHVLENIGNIRPE